MNKIKQMLTGQIEMSTFTALLKTDSVLQEYVRALVPKVARDNRDHIFWQHISYESLKRHNYDFVSFLTWACRFDQTIGDNFNIFTFMRVVYCFEHPEIICTKKYEDEFSLYLDVAKNCYDGPEVRPIVEAIIYDSLQLRTKKQRKQHATDAIITQFHVVENKRPRWIQGAEWPMGIKSPMEFVTQKRKKGNSFL